MHTRNYEQVLAKLGGGASGSRLITPEEGAVLVEELEATAPFIDQRYADDVALAVRAALTDAELFVSYNMPAKALGPLMSALPKAPRDLRLNQRLAALHTRAGRFSEAAVCCRNLEQLYHDAGHPDEASRYSDLAGKYEERTSAKPVTETSHAPRRRCRLRQRPLLRPPSIISPRLRLRTLRLSDPRTFNLGTLLSHRGSPAAAASSEFEIRSEAPAPESEIDISAEWESELSDEPKAAAFAEMPQLRTRSPITARAETITETIEELRFYLAHSMAEQARVVFTKLEKLKPGAAQLAAVWQEIEAAEAKGSKQPEVVEEVSVDETDEVPSTPEPQSALRRRVQVRTRICFRSNSGFSGRIQAAPPSDCAHA